MLGHLISKFETRSRTTPSSMLPSCS